MKTLRVFLMTAVLAVVTNVAKAADVPATKEVTVGISDAFVPGGFDPSTEAYVVASGVFPNGCYSWKGAEVQTPETFTHEIKSVARVSQGMCIMVLVPFTKEIKLGKLAAGKHTLRFVNGDGTYLEKYMVVEE